MKETTKAVQILPLQRPGGGEEIAPDRQKRWNWGKDRGWESIWIL